MRKSYTTSHWRRLIMLSLALGALAALPLLSSARSATSIIIVNNSTRVIRNVYLSPTDSENWGSEQLGGSTIASGQSFTISNVACDQQQIKVIGEDQDGCFLSAVVACGTNATWTITNDTAANCGE
jgi:hypothetical protein